MSRPGAEIGARTGRSVKLCGMRRWIIAILSFAFVGTGVRSAAQEDWLPPAVEEGLTRQLVERLETIGPGKPSDREALLAGARERVRRLRTTIEGWKERGVIERTPAFTKVKLPAAGQRHLDAMTGYQVCNLILMKQFAEGEDVQTRRVGAMGLTAVTTVIVYLRAPFVAQGGTHAQIEAFLTSDEMERVAAEIQRSQPLTKDAQAACGKTVGQLFEAFG